MDEIKNNQPQDDGSEESGQKLVDYEKKCEEYLAGWQRAKADFINYKKEEVVRLEEIAKYGNVDLVRDIVGVLDSFELGLQAMEKQGPVEKGVYMIKSQLEDVLRQRGAEKLKMKAGDRFDPLVAEAVAEVESNQPEGTIAEEVEAGWRIHDKILRPARVKLAKQKSENKN